MNGRNNHPLLEATFPLRNQINKLQYMDEIPEAALMDIRIQLANLRKLFEDKAIEELLTSCIRAVSFCLQAQEKNEYFKKLIKSIETIFNDVQLALQPAFPLMELPQELRRYVILPNISSDQDHVNFRRVNKESRMFSDSYWRESFEAQYKEEFKQYYSHLSKPELAVINWHHEFVKWEKWELLPSNEAINFISTADKLLSAILMEMPHAKLIQIIKLSNIQFSEIALNKLAEMMAYNVAKPLHVVSFLNLSSVLNVTRESLARRLMFAAIQHDPKWINNLAIILHPASGITHMVKEPGNIGWLFAALHRGYDVAAKMLLELECDPNVPQVENDIYKDSVPLFCALKTNNIQTVSLLFKFGAKLEYEGQPHLIDAIRFGHVKMVELLLSVGADVNKANQDDATPLSEAIRLGRIEIVNILISHRVKIDDSAYPGSYIQLAKDCQQPAILKLLLIEKYKAYIKKTKLRDADDKATRIKFNLFGKEVDVGVGSAAGDKLKRAKIYRNALLFGREEDKRKALENYRWENGELGEISKDAVSFFK